MKEIRVLTLILFLLFLLLATVWIMFFPAQPSLGPCLVSFFFGTALCVLACLILVYHRKKRYWEPQLNIMRRDLAACQRFVARYLHGSFGNRTMDEGSASSATVKTELYLKDVEDGLHKRIRDFSFPRELGPLATCFFECANVFKEKIIQPYQSYLSHQMLTSIEQLREKSLFMHTYARAMLSAYARSEAVSRERLDGFKDRMEGCVKEIIRLVRSMNELCAKDDSVLRKYI